jgi:hypothetical protein
MANAFPGMLATITNTAFGKAIVTIFAIFWIVIVLSILWRILPKGRLGNDRGSAPIINDLAGAGAAGFRAGGRGFSWLAGKAGDALRLKLSERKLNRTEEQANKLISKLEQDLVFEEKEELSLLGKMITALRQINAMQQAGRMDGTRLSDVLSKS